MFPKISLHYVVISNLGVVATDFYGASVCGGVPWPFLTESHANLIRDELNNHPPGRVCGKFVVNRVGHIHLDDTVWLYSSLTFLLFQHFLDRCRANPPKRRFEAEILEVIDLEADSLTVGREQEEPPLYGWDFIPAAHDVLFCSTGPAPKPVMVCGVEDGLAVMNGEKLVEDVQFTPLKMPAKNVFSDLTEDDSAPWPRARDARVSPRG